MNLDSNFVHPITQCSLSNRNRVSGTLFGSLSKGVLKTQSSNSEVLNEKRWEWPLHTASFFAHLLLVDRDLKGIPTCQHFEEKIFFDKNENMIMTGMLGDFTIRANDRERGARAFRPHIVLNTSWPIRFPDCRLVTTGNIQLVTHNLYDTSDQSGMRTGRWKCSKV